MGGCCCCASRSTELHRPPPFCHVSEEREPLSAHRTRVVALSTGFLIDTNLDTSDPDTYQPPPAPIPYETYASSDNRDSSGNKTDEVLQTVKKPDSDETTKLNTELEASDDMEHEGADQLKKSSFLQDEEDVCPTCFEEYNNENPKIITKCDHHFHLSCILEWKERSDTCPVCDQEMVFSPVPAGG